MLVANFAFEQWLGVYLAFIKLLLHKIVAGNNPNECSVTETTSCKTKSKVSKLNKTKTVKKSAN